LLRVGQDGVAQLLGVDGHEWIHFEGDELAVDAQLGGRPGGDVEVRRSLLEHHLEELVEVDLRHASATVTRRTSSGVVTPSRTLVHPDMRSVRTPCRIISALISAPDAPSRTSSFSCSMNGMTS